MRAAVGYLFTQDKTAMDVLVKSEFSAAQIERHFHALQRRLQRGIDSATLANLPVPTILLQIKNGESEYRLAGDFRISDTANALMLAELWTDVMIAADHVYGICLDSTIRPRQRHTHIEKRPLWI